MTNLRINLRREPHISIVNGSAGAVQTNGSGFWAVHVLKPDWIKDAPALPSAERAKISKATKERWAKYRAAKAKGKRNEGKGSRAPQNLLRVSVGLEHPDDLIGDLLQALA